MVDEQDIRNKYDNESSKDLASQRFAELMLNFAYDHLPPEVRGFSQQCYDLAANMMHDVREGDELYAGLRKLLEAKDCFVRAALRGQKNDGGAVSP